MHVNIKVELRPCLVLLRGIRHRAYFHMWHTGDNDINGLVELENGAVCLVPPQSITFMKAVKTEIDDND